MMAHLQCRYPIMATYLALAVAAGGNAWEDKVCESILGVFLRGCYAGPRLLVAKLVEVQWH